MNPYSVLGVRTTSSDDEIKAQYRSMVQKHHPDKGGTTEGFNRIQEAYDAIVESRKVQPQRGPKTHTHSNEPWRHASYRTTRTNPPVTITVRLTWAETFKKTTKIISFRAMGEQCTREVEIKAGVAKGDRIRYTGLGTQLIKDIPPGDMVVLIEVENNPNIARKNNDVHMAVDVDCFTAMLGGSLKITHPSGEALSVSISAGTATGSTARLRDKGYNAGHLYLVYNVTVPALKTDEQKELAKKLALSLNM